MISAWRIQYAESTGRFHPVAYRDAPLPGPGPHEVRRMKSYGHHTEGFLTEEEAQADIRERATYLAVPVEGVPVIHVETPGADVLLMSEEVNDARMGDDPDGKGQPGG